MTYPAATARPGVGPTKLKSRYFLGIESLSRAERKVAEHLSRGLSNKEIGAALNRSHLTVNSQVSSILCKCGVSNRARFVAQFIEVSHSADPEILGHSQLCVWDRRRATKPAAVTTVAPAS